LHNESWDKQNLILRVSGAKIAGMAADFLIAASLRSRFADPPIRLDGL
jgi:hypothetical protein